MFRRSVVCLLLLLVPSFVRAQEGQPLPVLASVTLEQSPGPDNAPTLRLTFPQLPPTPGHSALTVEEARAVVADDRGLEALEKP